LNYGRLY